MCGTAVTLSGARYFDVIPWTDPHWRRVYKTASRAAAMFSSLQSTMTRASCTACAPAGAKCRKGRLVPKDKLTGPPQLVAFVREHYAALNRGVPSLAQQVRWASRYAAHTNPQMATSSFIAHVWGTMRRPPRPCQARQT